ncbi:MAG TPA: carboxymuconolactone decarboxylase family protein [Xanthobacteraceae bacterium]|nr:carboxymuconolactone decarboxylase family protein [Xanthobacteraceae bacterium]
MARIGDVKRENLNPRQQQLFDHFLTTRPARGDFSGPFAVLINTPDLAEPADKIVNYFRGSPKLERRLIELIILMMCREATAQYAWSVHEPNALKTGLTQETIDAIRARKRPPFKRDDEALIYDLVTELNRTKTLAAATFDRAKTAFGLEGLIEAITCAGFYGMIGLVLNSFEIPPRAGVPLA